jgi:Flp pilus assembly protein TadG
MRTHALAAAEQPAAKKPVSLRQLSQRFLRDDDGTTAVEFGLIAVPFVTMLLGIMSVCLYFFVVLETENAVWQGSRDLRTGQLQTASGSYAGLTGDQLKDKLKQSICNRTRDASVCMARMRVLVQTRTSFGTLTQPSCRDPVDNGKIITEADAKSGFNAGGASSVVILTGCYSWEFGANLPFFKLGNLTDGSFLVQSTYAFRTEPYN